MLFWTWTHAEERKLTSCPPQLFNNRGICTMHFRELHTKWFSKTVRILMSTEIHISQGFSIHLYWQLGQVILCRAVLCTVGYWAASRVSTYHISAPLANCDNEQCLWTCTMSPGGQPQLRSLRKQMLRDILPGCAMQRNHCCAPCILTELSWDEHQLIKQKTSLNVHHIISEPSEAKYWIALFGSTLPLNPRLCGSFLDGKGFAMEMSQWFPNMAISEWPPKLFQRIASRSRPWRVSFSGNWVKPWSQYVLFKHRLMMSEVLNPLVSLR